MGYATRMAAAVGGMWDAGKAAIFIACTVTAVWAGATVWSIIHPAYHEDPALNGIMLTIGGAFLSIGMLQQRRSRNNNDDKEG